MEAGLAKKKKKKELAFSIKLAKARTTLLNVKKVADAAVKAGQKRLGGLAGTKDKLKKAQVENALLRAVKAQQSLDSAHQLLFYACCNQVHNCDPDYS